ncbi:MAG TPA: FtsQ-type POTRA domain-containing protein [Candidatus Lustribacter sp.]|nr:FtsQ-type POTRA domain-containing protein [Candidatus Lustribacter sp.]
MSRPGFHGSRSPRPSPARDSRGLFEARAAAVRRGRLLRLSRSGAVVVLLIALIWLVAFSPLLASRSVVVSGVSGAPRAAVTAAAAVPLGVPLARLDIAAIQLRVKALPTVDTVTVSRSWPTTVLITATLKKPAIVLQNSQGQLDVVAPDGLVIERVTAAPDGLPVVRGGAQAPTPEGIAAALGFVKVLSAAQRKQVSEITVSASFVTARWGTLKVVWGDGSRAGTKARLLTILLATKPASLIDVSAPDTPVTR